MITKDVTSLNTYIISGFNAYYFIHKKNLKESVNYKYISRYFETNMDCTKLLSQLTLSIKNHRTF